MAKPSIPKGTRDFGPVETARRQYIFGTIQHAFKKYGFAQIETPAMENTETLMGKYGDEGDRLIFKILNSGDYLKKVGDNDLSNRDSQQILRSISEKALRYDLTVPFARFVVQHQNEITFPFKRYQIQPVWRADRPQKGRYREFYQCDADVVGSDSLLYEVELVQIFNEVLANLGIPSFTIKINNRKVLSGIAEVIGEPEKIVDITVAIDKLDKIGKDGVNKELKEKGINDEATAKIQPLIDFTGSTSEKLTFLKELLASSEVGMNGIAELEYIFQTLESLETSGDKSVTDNVELDITLARGLNYYTGAIFEVKANNVSIGSICGGGRYDDLTGVFGAKEKLSGVGISFGADRIYDVLNELNLFPAEVQAHLKVLVINFGEKEALEGMKLVQKLRAKNIASEVYPDAAKMKKQMKYANDKHVPFVVLIGSEELNQGKFTLKNMETGNQEMISAEQLLQAVQA